MLSDQELLKWYKVYVDEDDIVHVEFFSRGEDII